MFSGCISQVPEEGMPGTGDGIQEDLSTLVDLASGHLDREERARRLFVLADRAYARYLESSGTSQLQKTAGSPKTAADTPGHYRETALGALLRVVELNAGPVDKARHNLAILFRQENQDKSPGESDPGVPDGKEDSSGNPGESPSEAQDQGEQSSREPRDLSSQIRDRPAEDKNKEALLAKEQQFRREKEGVPAGPAAPVPEDW